MDNTNSVRIGLALSGGVARGPVHVGILSALQQAGIPIHCVAGASAGSIVGAAFCAGLSIPKMRALAAQTGWRDVARPVLPRRGLVSFEPMEGFIDRVLGPLFIEDLPLPYAAVAADLQRGEEVVLRSGKLATAVRASCSVPGLVTPVEVDGRLLCDGGVANNLPVDAARALGADYVIGVDLFVPGSHRFGPLGVGASALETLIRLSGGGYKSADCLIVPDLSGKTYVRFSKSEEYMLLGEAAARAALPRIKHDLAERMPDFAW